LPRRNFPLAQIAELLLHKGASLGIQDQAGRTVLQEIRICRSDASFADRIEELARILQSSPSQPSPEGS
jgi:hypothetical protein